MDKGTKKTLIYTNFVRTTYTKFSRAPSFDMLKLLKSIFLDAKKKSRNQANPIPRHTPRANPTRPPQTQGAARRPAGAMPLPYLGTQAKPSMGTWVYRHRMGLMVTIIVHLTLIIAFLTYQIILQPSPSKMVEIEIIDEVEMVEQVVEEAPVEQEEIDMQNISNRISNDNSELDASLRDDRATASDELYEEAQRVQEALSENSSSQSEGLAQLDAANRRAKEQREQRLKDQQQGESGKDDRDERARYSGNVTAEYDLSNPKREDELLYIPAYRCEGGGRVIVNITVNRNGKVIQAEVHSSSADDECLQRMATQAAKASKFNLDNSAPEKQKGTITYLFVAQ